MHSCRAEDGAPSVLLQIPLFKRRHQIDDYSILKLRLEHLKFWVLQGCRQQGCTALYTGYPTMHLGCLGWTKRV